MANTEPTIEFYLDNRAGVAPYLQLVHQVKQALRLGYLKPGDQLPTMREVVSKLAINPNTVFNAYRTLELEGLVGSRPGLGTFIQKSLADPSLENHEMQRQELVRWVQGAYHAGLQEESIQALFESVLQELKKKYEDGIA